MKVMKALFNLQSSEDYISALATKEKRRRRKKQCTI